MANQTLPAKASRRRQTKLKNKKNKVGELAKPYEPTTAEQTVMEKIRDKPRLPEIKVTKESELTIDHKDSWVGACMLMDALGTDSIPFMHGLLSQLANAGSKGKQVNEDSLNFMLSVVEGIKPRDEVEAMLASQMAATQMAIMTFARRLNHVDNIQQQDSASRAFNQLARTFAAQVEALKKYRSNGEQRVTVQHVQVNEGGQAVVAGEIGR